MYQLAEWPTCQRTDLVEEKKKKIPFPYVHSTLVLREVQGVSGGEAQTAITL